MKTEPVFEGGRMVGHRLAEVLPLDEEATRVASMITHYRNRVTTLENQLSAMTVSRREVMLRAQAAERKISEMLIERHRLIQMSIASPDTLVSALSALYSDVSVR